MSWIDANFQAIFSAKNIVKIAKILDRKDEVAFLEDEAEYLENYVNQKVWDNEKNFYFDRYRNGELSTVKTIGAFWGIIADAVPKNRLEAFISHLKDEKQFKRPHRVPSINADHPDYKFDGGYWMGGVWPPTNYMILRGLTKIGENDLAFDIAENHLRNVWAVYKKYDTVFENYSPEFEEPGKPSRRDFVGWGGLPPVAVFLEYYLGIRPNLPEKQIIWDIRLSQEHGILKYPFGKTGLIDLKCEKRNSTNEEPNITAKSNESITIIVRWKNKEKILKT